MDRPIESKVTDWASDFDHADPAYNRHAHQIWDDLRSRCPVAHSDRYGGVWLPVTHELVREIAYDTEHFTSRSVVVSTMVRPPRRRAQMAADSATRAMCDGSPGLGKSCGT